MVATSQKYLIRNLAKKVSVRFSDMRTIHSSFLSNIAKNAIYLKRNQPYL
jgi:hypothetical protein